MTITRDGLQNKSDRQLAAYFNTLISQLGKPSKSRDALLSQLALIIAERQRRGPAP